MRPLSTGSVSSPHAPNASLAAARFPARQMLAPGAVTL
jgi:hypothetical protein